MDGVTTLLREARSAGLKLRAEGSDLKIKGPARAEPVVRELIAHKPEVMALLRAGALLRRVETRNRKIAAESWFRELRACRERLEACGSAVLEYAHSRWADCAEGWPAPLLCGLYVADLLAGLEGTLGSWGGWEPIGAAVESGKGPRVIAELWRIYRDLPDDLRSRVRDAGDRSQSPPEAHRKWMCDA